MLIDTLTAKLTADASGFTPVMERAGQQLRGFGGHAESANHGLTLVRRGFESLAIQATGVSGPVGRVAQGLLSIGAGSATVLGVTAGIGIIAAGYKLLTSTTNELSEAHKKLQASFESAMAAGKANVQSWLQFRSATEDLEKAQEKLAELQRNQARVGGTGPLWARAIAEATDNVHIAEQAVEAFRGTWHKASADVIDKANDANEAFLNIADAFKVIQGNVAALVNDPNFQTFLQSIPVETNFGPTKTEQGFANMANVVKGGMERGAPLKGPGTSAEFLKHGFEPGVNAIEFELKERGAEIGASFVMAIAQGAKNAGDFLKQVMLQIANFAIVHVFKLALGIASPSRVGVDLGKNFSLGLATGVGAGAPAVGGASGAVASRMAGSAAFSLSLSGMPPAMNPLAAARDQEYQRFFREGALVAKASGFQFA